MNCLWENLSFVICALGGGGWFCWVKAVMYEWWGAGKVTGEGTQPLINDDDEDT